MKKQPQTKQKVIMKFKNDDFLLQLLDLLLKTGKVKVTGLGIFEIRNINAREGYNVGSGDRITIPAHKKIAFKPAKTFKDQINNETN